MNLICLFINILFFEYIYTTNDYWLDEKFDTEELNQIKDSKFIKNYPNYFKNLSEKKNKTYLNTDYNTIETSINDIKKSKLEEKFELDDLELNTTNKLDNRETNNNLSSKFNKQVKPKVYSVFLDPDKLLTLFWSVNYEQQFIIFEIKFNLPNQIKAPFIAFGFSAYGEIENSDLCVLWNDYENKYHFQDTWTDANGFLNVDKENNCELLTTKKTGNQLFFLFKRKFNTCDKHDFKIEKGTNHLVYALGNGKLHQAYGLRLSKIKRKGFTRVSLLKPQIDPSKLDPDEVQTIDFVVPKSTVPNVETTYWCSIHKLTNDFEQKKHVIRYESIIQKGNEDLVHHMELFHCELDASIIIPFYSGSCTGSKAPDLIKKCKRVIAAWAMGASPLTYPKEAGLSVGGRNFSSFLMLEIHYNNPNLKSNVLDSSGMRIFYTSKLRKYDIGILEIGLEYSAKNSIPPNQSRFILQGHCVPECTRAGIPENGINIIASQLHTHLTGVSVYTKHYREGSELAEINRDNYYSTHFQEIRLLEKPVKILPGDALVNYCVYNTKKIKNITLGGYGIRDEMCVNYMHYYPKIDLEVCKSSVDTKHLLKFFEYLAEIQNQPLEKYLVDKSENLNENLVTTLYKNVRWNPFLVEILKNFYNQSPLSMQCNRSSGERFPGNWNGVALTPVFNERILEKNDCSSLDQI